MEKKEEVGEPRISWGEAEDGSATIDVVIMGDCVGVRYGQIALVFREGDRVPKADE